MFVLLKANLAGSWEHAVSFPSLLEPGFRRRWSARDVQWGGHLRKKDKCRTSLQI